MVIGPVSDVISADVICMLGSRCRLILLITHVL